MEFRADGTMVDFAIGRGDAPAPGPPGRWEASGRLTLPAGKTGRVVTATPDHLEITWQP